jgi:hypothetical protein
VVLFGGRDGSGRRIDGLRGGERQGKGRVACGVVPSSEEEEGAAPRVTAGTRSGAEARRGGGRAEALGRGKKKGEGRKEGKEVKRKRRKEEKGKRKKKIGEGKRKLRKKGKRKIGKEEKGLEIWEKS